jgi:hypothetical protein
MSMAFGSMLGEVRLAVGATLVRGLGKVSEVWLNYW